MAEALNGSAFEPIGVPINGVLDIFRVTMLLVEI